MDAKNKNKLLNLISKFLEEKASTKEIKNLYNFFLSHQKITKWPENFESKEIIEDKIYDKIQSSVKIGPYKSIKKVIPLYQRNIFKYAAAILIFVSAGYFFLTKEETTQNTAPIIVNNNIKTGTDKATLTLGDGTNVTLEKGKDYIAEHIESNGEEIIYANSNNSKSDIVYNYLTIPRGGQYFVKLSDGTQIWLNSESQLKYPENFIQGQIREVELVYGEAYFDVSPSTDHDGAKFKVIHRKQEVEVLGTEFNIKAYNDETEVFTTLVEGVVKVGNSSDSKILEPDQQTIIADASNIIYVHAVNAKGETSWRRGVFDFNDKSLKEILKVLSRWYDMDVIIVDKDIESELFTGTFGKEQNIEDILFLINKLTNIQYEINNKTIFLRK